MPGSARLRPRWPSPPWLRCCCYARRGSRPYQCRCVVSTPRGRPPGWPHGETQRPSPPCSPRREHQWICVATADTSSQGSAAVRPCCPGWSSSGKPSPRRSPASDDAGAATVLAAVLIAALVTITLGGIWLGAVEVARHRAQAAADLAALAAASRLSLGPDTACRHASQLAATMRAAVRDCDVEELDVVVTVTVRTGGLMGEARAASRAGPAARTRS